MPKRAKQDKLEEELKVEPIPLPSSQDQAKLSAYIDKLNKARDERNLPRKEFDGMTFEQDYERNRECTYSYLRPKKNDDDVRVNSGTAEKKIELMLNELMGMNFQPEVRAYDEHDLELLDLGVDFTDLVRTTNEQETDEDLWEELYLDLLTQRVALVEECLTDFLPGGYMAGPKKKRDRGIKRRISPLQLYFGDMYIPVRRMNEQPYLVVYDRMLYSEAKVLYGHLEEFKYVRPGSGIHDEYLPWFKYRFSTLKQEEVETIRILSSAAHEDDDQLIINSVMMFPKGRKMKIRNGYPIKGATVKMIPDFVYGKPPIASAKFLQALQDETLRNLIRKMRQAIEPPSGVQGTKVPTRDMWNPAALTQGISKENFSKLIDHDGVTPSEFNMYNLIVQKTEEFIGATNIQTQPGEGVMTATQIIELQKQAIKMIGLAVLAIIRLKRDATFARLETLTCDYTKPVSERAEGGQVKKQYRTFEIENGRNTQGETVKKFVAFIDRSLSKEEMRAVKEQEDDQSDKEGKEVRYSFLNVEVLKSIPILFKVTVTPESRDSSSLDKIMFIDRLNQAATVAQLTGKKLNGEKMIEDFERTWKTRGMFEEAITAPGGTPQDMNQMMGELDKMQQATTQVLGSPQGQDLKAGPTAKPSLESLVNTPQ